MINSSKNIKHCSKVCWLGLAIIVITLTMILTASRGCSPEVEPSPTIGPTEQIEKLVAPERNEENLSIPEEIKEQGTSGLTKLNPDPEVKEEW